jgi:hypothetical protein
MSDPNPKPLPPWLLPAIILLIDVVVIVWLGSRGVLERMPPVAQFFYGATTLAMPLFIYWYLKRKQDRGE